MHEDGHDGQLGSDTDGEIDAGLEPGLVADDLSARERLRVRRETLQRMAREVLDEPSGEAP